MRSVPILIAAAAAACTPYRSGSFAIGAEPFVGDVTTAGCLDLGVDVVREPLVPGPVVHYQFGNRCDGTVVIDLARVRVVGRGPAGEEIAMVAYDPDGAMVPLPLDGHTAGRERIEYRTQRDFDGGDVIQVCVAIGTLAGTDAPSPLQTTCRSVPPAPKPEPQTEIAEVTP